RPVGRRTAAAAAALRLVPAAGPGPDAGGVVAGGTAMRSAEGGGRRAECKTGRIRLLVSLSPCLLVSLLAAAPEPPDDLVRQGNAAFERGEVTGAEGLYGKAEERAVDPGLVAFNKADALYQQEKYREAEVHFRRALGDAAIPPERRHRALYN